MAATSVRSKQITDGQVQRVDLDVSNSGTAVIAKAIAGTGISLSQTGPDAGTGDVTITNAGLLTPSVATPTRTLNSNFTPSATRPVLCIYSIQINSGNNVDGQVELRSDSAATPTTARAMIRSQIAVSGLLGVSGSTISAGVLVYLVPATHNVRLVTINNSGTPTFTLVNQVEITI